VKIAGIILGMAMFVAVPLAYSEQPAQLRGQADYKVGAAEQLIKNAQMTAETYRNAEGIRKAVIMLTQAGQLFEQAARIYQKLVPEYATVEDVKNADEKMQYCIEAIKQLTGRK